MQDYLGHLAAVIVFVVVSGVLFSVQQRGQLQSVEESVRYTATARAVELARMLEHDLDNLLDASAAGVPATCEGNADGLTTTLSFTSQDPLSLAEVRVTYRILPTTETAPVGGREVRLYEVEREVATPAGTVETVGGLIALTAFDVTFVAAGGAAVGCAAPGKRSAPEGLDAVRVRLVTSTPNPVTRVAADQAAPERLFLRSYGFTVRPINLRR